MGEGCANGYHLCLGEAAYTIGVDDDGKMGAYAESCGSQQWLRKWRTAGAGDKAPGVLYAAVDAIDDREVEGDSYCSGDFVTAEEAAFVVGVGEGGDERLDLFKES